MRKQNLLTIIAIIVVAIMAISFTGCAFTEPPDGETTDPSKEYTLQYVDESGTKTIKVKSGDVYSLESIPTKTGHEFLGLFDAAEGGTQYVAANGSALAPFTDNKNMILYPQFRANDYTLILDYGGAEVTGARSLPATYGGAIPPLPLSLTVINKEFCGWFTQPSCGGAQIADAYGILPNKSIVNERTLDLSDPDGYIQLYAGFVGEKRTVTFYFDDFSTPEDLQVEHGTLIKSVVPSTRVDGKAVLLWSKIKNDVDKTNIFSGKVESDMILYAAEYAPVIDFNVSGGRPVTAIVAREGDSITLPTAERENFVFGGWKTADGSFASLTVMPQSSMVLTAVWKAQLIFDTRGGEPIPNIVQEAGTAVTLPISDKTGYIFAGWYTESDVLYKNEIMPTTTVKLKAKYYKAAVRKVVFGTGHDSAIYSTSNHSPYITSSFKINISDLFKSLKVESLTLKIRWYGTMFLNHGTFVPGITQYLSFYSQNSVADEYLLAEQELKMVENETLLFDFQTIFTVEQNFHISWHISSGTGNIDAFSCDINYPDTSTLY